MNFNETYMKDLLKQWGETRCCPDLVFGTGDGLFFTGGV